MHVERTANLLGATALALTDLAIGSTAADSGLSPSSSAALASLAAASGLRVTELGARIGLSQSATTRVVDAMEAQGFVRRRATAGRGVIVDLTRSGKTAARKVLAARTAPLLELVEVLDEHQQRSLDAALETLLGHLYHQVGDAQLMCRLCDRDACTTDASCPVGEAERQDR